MKARYLGELSHAVNDPNTGYFFEVDLEYPPELHDRDDDYPLAPELFEITTEMLSEKQHALRRKYYGASNPYSRKLVCSLLPKKHYMLFGEMLKFYLERGLKVTKVHRAIKVHHGRNAPAVHRLQHKAEGRERNRRVQAIVLQDDEQRALRQDHRERRQAH